MNTMLCFSDVHIITLCFKLKLTDKRVYETLKEAKTVLSNMHNLSDGEVHSSKLIFINSRICIFQVRSNDFADTTGSGKPAYTIQDITGKIETH